MIFHLYAYVTAKVEECSRATERSRSATAARELSPDEAKEQRSSPDHRKQKDRRRLAGASWATDMRSSGMVRDRVSLGEVGVESRLTSVRGLGITHIRPNHNLRGRDALDMQHVAEDEYERRGHQEQEASNPWTVHGYETSCGRSLFNFFRADAASAPKI